MLALDGAVPAGWVRSRQDGCAKPMIGYGIGSRSDDLWLATKDQLKKKKTREQEDQLGEREGERDSERAERVSFVLSLKR